MLAMRCIFVQASTGRRSPLDTVSSLLRSFTEGLRFDRVPSAHPAYLCIARFSSESENLSRFEMVFRRHPESLQRWTTLQAWCL